MEQISKWLSSKISRNFSLNEWVANFRIMNKSELVVLAEEIAEEAHLGQFRRGGKIPYIEHPKAVAGRVGPDFDAQIVAWLHDVIEDTEITADLLREKGFPNECIDAVVLLTKTKETEYETYLESVADSF